MTFKKPNLSKCLFKGVAFDKSLEKITNNSELIDNND